MKDKSRVALFWEMRLGKTLTIILWIKARKAKPVLVVCPLDVMETWLDELRLEGLEGEIRRGFSCKPTTAPWQLTSYETLRGNVNLQNYPWGAVILDESTAIKNPKAKITKVCIQRFSEVPVKAILTGTPAPESILEYFPQMQFLNGSFLGYNNFWNFRSSLFSPDYFGWHWLPNKGTRSAILKGIRECAHVLSRNQVGLGNVEMKETRRIKMPLKLRSIYRHAEERFTLRDQRTQWRPAVQTWLARLAGGCHPLAMDDYKVDALLELLRTDLSRQQVVVWCCFNSEIDRLVAKLDDKKSCGIIRGSVKSSDRTKVNRAFQSGKLRILFCQPKCAQHGRNFSAASASVFFSLPWDLKSYLQAKDRIAHPNKKEPILTLHLVGRDTVDEDVLSALHNKRYKSISFKEAIGRNFMERVCPRNA